MRCLWWFLNFVRNIKNHYNGHSWKCELYGMRILLQEKDYVRKIPFEEWSWGFLGGPILLLEFWKLCYFNEENDDGKKKKKRYFADPCCHLLPDGGVQCTTLTFCYWRQESLTSVFLNASACCLEPGCLTESLLRALVTPVFLLSWRRYCVPTPR